MKNPLLFTIICIVLTILGLLGLSNSNAVQDANCICTKVYDGDTITIEQNGKKSRVRLWGIDAPELNQLYGKESCEQLKKLVLNKEIEVREVAKDRYGRSVCKVYRQNVCVNTSMVYTGHAWWYEQYAKDFELRSNQENARKAKRGLWYYPNPVPPWEYRKGNDNTPIEKTFWQSGKVHNSRCKYYKQGNGILTENPTGEDCKLCGGRNQTK